MSDTRVFKEGDYVKFNAPTGSIGRIEALNHYGGYYVRWTFGRDVKGEEMSSSLSSCTDRELLPISKDIYEKARDGKPFKGDRQ